VGSITRVQALLPRRVAEAIIRYTKGDRLLISADPAARAAYEARISGATVLAEPAATEPHTADPAAEERTAA
jgi:hypothetical protein